MIGESKKLTKVGTFCYIIFRFSKNSPLSSKGIECSIEVELKRMIEVGKRTSGGPLEIGLVSHQVS